MESVLRYIHQNRDRYIAELKEFLTIPSISNNAENRADMERCAAFLKDQLESIGMQKAAVFPTDGHPVVYGEWLGAPGKPTVLFYGHYDVQPVDPLPLWHSEPFEAVIRALNDIGYAGPLSIEWEDAGMDREHGATESCAYTRKVDFPPSEIAFDAAFAE